MYRDIIKKSFMYTSYTHTYFKRDDNIFCLHGINMYYDHKNAR